MDGKTIRLLRRSMGLSQADLAHRVGVDQGTISRWEREAESPRPSNLVALQGALSPAREGVHSNRVRAFLDYDMVPAVRMDRRMRLEDYSRHAARHYLEKHGVDLEKLKGTSFKEHCFRMGVPELWETAKRCGLLQGKISVFRFVMNLRGRGHSTIYEPIFKGEEVDGFFGYIVGFYDFPENEEISVELIQAVPMGSEVGLMNLLRGEYASIIDP